MTPLALGKTQIVGVWEPTSPQQTPSRGLSPPEKLLFAFLDAESPGCQGLPRAPIQPFAALTFSFSSTENLPTLSADKLKEPTSIIRSAFTFIPLTHQKWPFHHESYPNIYK